ncbi:MAG: 8-oxoguanine deaminase [Thiofilum sp.]|uniref:8-oxoguanine deaminase n=1 Tax=Thiofilum sp. TaxID=2212733 RepID=UPI0025EE0C6C|nr:8-oxoguanine deaminase [Thiofilum sp.]MBK8453485.1 8-oxoguanine deaminase [Thiofilum sp.]
MSIVWLKNPLALFDGLNELNSAGVVIQDNKIIEVLSPNQTPSTPVDQTFDASEYVILPGLINTHHHFYQTLTRAYPAALNKELFPWLQTLYPVWAGLEPEMLTVATELALTELMLSGCTTAADHHYLFPQGLEYAIDTQVEAAKKVGTRVTLTRGSMSLGKDQGGLPPQSTVQTEQVILDDSERLIRDYHEPHEGAKIQIALAPCSPFSVTTDLMKASAQLAQTYNVHLHTHLAETLDEEAFCLKRFGLRTVDYLESVGWLHNKTWLAHGIHFNDEEIQRLGQAGVGICHCPNSNMMLASGICRTLELEQAGSPVGLGVDGSASNDHSNLISEVRQALYLQRLRYGSARMTHLDAYRFATNGSAKVLGRNDIGQIAVGYQADLALFKLDELRFSGHHDPLAALLLCGAQRAHRVMIAGQWTVVDGNPVHIDLQELMQRHQAAARRLAQKACAYA